MWPDIPYEPWRPTCEALHLYTQIVGKYRLARTPWVNHSWHATLYVDGRGLTTSLVPDGAGGIEIVFDLVRHELLGFATDGRRAGFRLRPMSVAAFHSAFCGVLRELGGTPEFHDHPSELPDPVRFVDDRAERPYDAAAVTRFFEALVGAHNVLSRFRTSFLGKASPVHLFWGSFDLVLTRFSGKRAPLHPGGVTGLPDDVVREAYSHEVSSCGFWPGDRNYPRPAFYAYAYPEPEGYARAPVEPSAGAYDEKMREFILPYEAARASRDPEAVVMRFLETTYRAAADLGRWDCPSLECELGEPLRPRPV